MSGAGDTVKRGEWNPLLKCPQVCIQSSCRTAVLSPAKALREVMGFLDNVDELCLP